MHRESNSANLDRTDGSESVEVESTKCPARGSAVESPDAEAALARGMPWIISLVFHLGLALVMMFVAMLVLDTPADREIAPQEGFRDKTERLRISLDHTHFQSSTNSDGWRSRRAPGAGVRRPTVTLASYQPDRPSGVGVPDGRRPGRGRGVPDGTGDEGPPVDVFRQKRRAADAVFVIDRSGSMSSGGAFDILRCELALSVGGLVPSQRFHLIFFGPDEPVEMAPGRLVSATDRSKMRAADFLDELVPRGRTQVLPALKRAFEVMGAAGGDGPKLIVLLSDGDFDGLGRASNEYDGKVGNEAVMAWLRDHNRGDDGEPKYVLDTYLYGSDDAEAAEVMARIAAENGGSSHVVSH